MKTKVSKILFVVIILAITLSSFTVFAQNDYRMQVYFAPSVMNDVTGDINVDMMLRNFGAMPSHYGEICGMNIEFEYNSENFDIKTKEDGTLDIKSSDEYLIKTLSDVETKVDKEKGRVSVTFLDSTLSKNLIGGDGKLFAFTLVSKQVMAFWNSANSYPLSFVPDGIGIVTYHKPSSAISLFENVEGIDIKVGSYNVPPTLTAKSVGKHLTFTDGSADVKINDEVITTDAIVYVKGDAFMLPIRYLAESIGMKVEWDGEKMVATATTNYKTIKVNQVSGKIHINSTQYKPSVEVETIDGRIFIPQDVVTRLYPNAEITINGDSIDIYIP